jgi:tetratricopeptide (TPR) repeat protein/S1-C subfamily serine protease
MYRSSWFLTAALVGTNVALVQPLATAKSASEVETVARAVSVEIKLQQNKSVGSGVIIYRQDDLYTLVTNRHVVCGDRLCSTLPAGENYILNLADGQQYQVEKSSIKLLGNNLDLAIIQFRSNHNYAVAKVADPESLKRGNSVYTAGFPFEPPGFTFGKGTTIAVVNKRLIGDNGGYTIIHSAFTLPGMSGGGVFDSNGQLVAIHGWGDRYKEDTEIDNQSRVNSKIGYNRGIPIRWLLQNLTGTGINLNRPTSSIRVARSQMPTTADEYFIAGFNNFVDPGDNVAAGKQRAIQDFSKAIQLDPTYLMAYFMRAVTYEQVQDLKSSLNDYNQAIVIDPEFSEVYSNRALIKVQLNDFAGALSDFNLAISISPNNHEAYHNRAALKEDKFNDFVGALSDYNSAISINPKYHEAYNHRAGLKHLHLNDKQGAMADYDQAIIINPRYATAYANRALLKRFQLDNLGALADFDMAIVINPKYSQVYFHRANLKRLRLNNDPGALADFDMAIATNPKYFQAYLDRGILKHTKLNDVPGALADYSQAININPKYAEAYFNRAILKYQNLNDRAGAIQDFRQAARLYREQNKPQDVQETIRALKIVGATE